MALWALWYWAVLPVVPPSLRFGDRRLLIITPLVCAAILYVILKKFASHDVRDAPIYLCFYMVMGAAWTGLGTLVLSFFGLSARDDVLERGNKSAAYAIAGGLIGITLCFSGGNIGDGPGWWVVIFAAALSSSSFLVLWCVLDRLTAMADRITVERDMAAGIRLAGFFLGIGMVLGRAVAGTWVSAEATISDFVRIGWPALLLLGIALPMEKFLRSNFHNLSQGIVLKGAVPAVGYVLIGIVILVLTGPWK